MRYYYYIQEVIDNYYNISLEERLKLIEMIKNYIQLIHMILE